MPERVQEIPGRNHAVLEHFVEAVGQPAVLDPESADGALEAFEGFLYQAELAQDPKIQIELYQKAVQLVRGHFLEDIDAVWVEPERERINQKFLSALLSLANLLKNNKQVHEALATCRQAIEHEPTFEEAYLASMKIYIQLDDHVGGLKLYETYKEMMRHELDLPPSPEMDTLYKRLMR